MRTTVELPRELMRAAKARSAESGESLKALLTRAVAAELATTPVARSHRARVSLPLFGSAGRRGVSVSSADLERALGDADAALIARPRHRSRKPR